MQAKGGKPEGVKGRGRPGIISRDLHQPARARAVILP